ncbi:MAG: cell wall protein [Nocardioides sp.]|uniref:cell wall protein n=1 Tax=Nocardioides sp. TaxID=35761 RepID=UPI0039E61C1B
MTRHTHNESHGRVVDRVPVVLPHLTITISGADEARLTATLNDEPYPFPSDLSSGRTAVGGLVERVASDAAQPVRVEVREADGTVFTEIVTPPPADAATSVTERATTTAAVDGRLEVGGSGFDPEEEVAVAVVVARQTAGPDGSARLRLPAALLASRPGTVVLLGRSSGFVAVSGNRA